MKILIYDDNVFTLELLRPLIEENIKDSTVITVSTIDEFFKYTVALTDPGWDIFICDWYLGISDGIELTAEKVVPNAKFKKLLIMSGSPIVFDSRLYADKHKARFIEKPILDTKKFIKIIQGMVREIENDTVQNR